MDFNGPGTLALVRNPMIRYTMPIGPATLTLAAENARGAQFGGAKFQTVPDFHANVGFAGPWGTLSLRGVTQYYRQTFTTPPAPRSTATRSRNWGFAGAVSGSLKLAGDTARLAVLGRARHRPLPAERARHRRLRRRAPYTSTHPGNMKLWTVYGAHLGYTHAWAPTLRSNLVGAGTWVSDPNIDGIAAAAPVAEAAPAGVREHLLVVREERRGRPRVRVRRVEVVLHRPPSRRATSTASTRRSTTTSSRKHSARPERSGARAAQSKGEDGIEGPGLVPGPFSFRPPRPWIMLHPGDWPCPHASPSQLPSSPSPPAAPSA